MKAAYRSLAMAAVIVMSPPALASEKECTAIVNALVLMVTQPIVRQIDTRPDFPGPITTIFSQDAIYANAGSTWKKMDVPASTRIEQMQALLKEPPLKNCKLVENTDSSVLQYSYDQGSNSATLWVDATGGLPHQFQTGSVLSKMEYEGVNVPNP